MKHVLPRFTEPQTLNLLVCVISAADMQWAAVAIVMDSNVLKNEF
jgi:hypothetical protein